MRKFLNNNYFNIYLVAILIVAAIFRFYGLNWDQNQHLHPDERFLTMVGGAMKIPNSFADYLNPKISTFNPANIGQPYFVYGVFPVVLNKVLAVVFQNDTYNNFTLQGRFLSGLADLFVVFIIFKATSLFEEKYKLHKSIKYLASFFYGIAILPIQLSHFFAVDIFLNLFMFASFYFALKFWFKNRFTHIAFSAIFLGLATASKITSVYILPLILFFIAVTPFVRKREKPLNAFLATIGAIIFFLVFFYVSLRLSDPYFFQNNNFLNPQISTLFMDNLKTLNSYSGKDTWYPPAIQWIHKPPIIFSLINLAVFGVGLPYFVFIMLGIYFIFIKIRKLEIFLILLWMLIFFVYQSSQFAKTIRYFIFIYPFLAIFTSIGFYHSAKNWSWQFRVLALLLILIWPLAFFSIYTKNHSRVSASEWIYDHIPYSTTISCEYWDDCLPLGLGDKSSNFYKIETLTLYDKDTQEKWIKINNQLTKIDYIVMSSNRLWGSIPTVPEKYPITSLFYADLFAEKLKFKKIAEITSYPSLRYLGIPLDFLDYWSDESFTVYDHPKVLIFQKEKGPK